jgi:hypothetical protein
VHPLQYIFSTIVYVIRWLLRGISLAEYKHSILYGENQEQVFDDEDEYDEEQKSHLLSKKRRFNVQVLLANQKVMDNDSTITPRTKNRNDGMYSYHCRYYHYYVFRLIYHDDLNDRS